MDYLDLPATGRVTIRNAVTPACFAGQGGTGFAPVSVTLEAGAVVPGAPDQIDPGQIVDARGGIMLPAFVDMHTHLDKGHIWGRAPNPDGTFMGALNTVAGDRSANWSAEDVRARMTFSLACGYAHGTRAVRTHLDSIPPQDDISWPVMAEVRADWADKITLQAAALVAIENVTADGAYAHTADLVAQFGGILGAVAYPVPDLDARLDVVFQVAAERGLSVDFHVDETLDADSQALRAIAQSIQRTGFDAPVVVGHCCSLSTQTDADAGRTLDMVARAGIHVVSLPMCNLYLQDRHANRTPRYRGITLVHEMVARGIPVSFASDNTRDPFYAYGDLDMIEVMREATRIGHLDHTHGAWPLAFSTTPAAACGFDAAPAPGQSADFILCNARNWTELFARPQSDRVVVRKGRAIDRRLPDYRDLDHLMG